MRGPDPGQPPRGVAALGEGDEVLDAEQLADLGSGGGDRPTLGVGARAERTDAVQAVGLGVLDDLGHGARPPRTACFADAGLAGEHQRVGAVEDGVRGVGGLGAGRAGVLDHRLEHLGGDDDGLGAAPGDLAGALLDERHLLERHLDAEVAAGDHDAVEGADDLVEVLDRLRLLDLRDDGEPAALLVHDLVDPADVVGGAHEGQRDHVDARCAGPSGGRPRPSRTAPARDTATPGRLIPLLLRQRAALEDLADDVGLGDLGGDEGDLAVVDEDPVPGCGRRPAGRRRWSRPR